LNTIGYGYIHPTNPLSPCVDVDVIGDFWPCRLANGAECPASACFPHFNKR
jgi:hypothetical protein